MNNRSFIPLLASFALLAFISCGSRGQGGGLTSPGLMSEGPNSGPVNAIAQAKPEIMVIPSDQLLKKYGALQVVSINGVNYNERDYSKYLLSNANNKAAVSVIQDEFLKLGYPLTNLEQTLKSIGNRQATDAADNLATDAKTLLLQKASPDIIIELDYQLSMDNSDMNFGKTLAYTVTAYDAFTNKSISSKTVNGVAGKDFKDMLTTSLHKNIKGVTNDIKNYFVEIMNQGREINVRFTVAKGAKINLSSECATGDTYSDWIMDYMDLNTKMGTYKLQSNTDYELFFTNVRIPVLREDGTQFSAYHWARKCINGLKEDCGVKATNKVQGLGDVHITIKGF